MAGADTAQPALTSLHGRDASLHVQVWKRFSRLRLEQLLSHCSEVAKTRQNSNGKEIQDVPVEISSLAVESLPFGQPMLILR